MCSVEGGYANGAPYPELNRVLVPVLGGMNGTELYILGIHVTVDIGLVIVVGALISAGVATVAEAEGVVEVRR